MNDALIIASLLPARTARILAKYGIETIDQIKARYPEKLLHIPGFGAKSLRAVEAAFFPGKEYIRKRRKYVKGRKQLKVSEQLAKYLRELKPTDLEGLR